ncbi:MAG: ATP-binding protein [Pseudomonadota bacterium]
MNDSDNGKAAQLEAERGIRDLMGLLALSALWLGKDGRTVLQLMLQAVEHLVPMRFTLTEAVILPGEARTCIARADGRLVAGETLESWCAASEHWPRTANIAATGAQSAATPLGAMKVVRLEFGVGTLGGGVWFGSDSTHFPSTTQLAILRAAASLAATALQAARVQHEREEAHRLKDEFLAMLGHELRNPLAPIRAGASLWRAPGVTPEQIQRTGVIIERQVKHMTGLVDDLLDVSRLSTGTVILDSELLDMRDIIQIAVEQTRTLIDAKCHALAVRIPDLALMVNGDRNRLVQIVSNLISNAAKYTPRDGDISLALGFTETTVVVTITDNGIGIESAMLPKIFELFTQVTRSTHRTDGGLGVGLALAQKLVKLHGGMLQARSAGLGHGATFEVIMQRAQPSAASCERIAAASARSTAAALKILVVDDNKDAGATMGEMLEGLGHTVLVADHPLEALRVACGFQADVYLLDIGLPEMDGYELARRLKAQPGLRRFSLIALTGYGQEDDRKDATSAGFDFHCTKPVDINVLNSILAKIAANKTT